MSIRAHTISAALLLSATLVTILLALNTAPLSLALPIESPTAAAYLDGFRGLEQNQTTSYRWSFSQATLLLHGFARSPLLLDMRLTSPRPAEALTAELSLSRGPWKTAAFGIQGNWRRYHILLPAGANRPEIALLASTFRPEGRDHRSLGVALSRLRLSPIAAPTLTTGLTMLSPWRTALLLLLPLLLYSLAARLLAQRANLAAAAFVPTLAGLAIVWSQASEPLAFALRLPEPWVPALIIATLTLNWIAWRPQLRPVEHATLRLLDQDRTRVAIILAAALVLGGIMVAIIPPWEQYDESAHFEFAWLIANHPTWPVPGTSDPRLAAIGGGGRALFHQPLYYLLASLPLRLVGGLDLVSQLYVARCFSLMLFLASVALAERTARLIFPAGHTMRWLAPLALALNPTFASLMTGVTNDAAVTAACTLAIWASARTLVLGLNWRRILGLIATIPLAILCKNTGAVVAGIVPLVLVVGFWQQHGWRWRWLLLGGAVACLAPLPIILAWGEPGHWYRWGNAFQGPVARVIQPVAPIGPHALRMQAVAVPEFEGISAPVVLDAQISNKPVTVGAWVWASRPATIWGPGIVYQTSAEALRGDNKSVVVDTQPRFVAFRYDIPPRLMYAQLMAWSVAPNDTQPLEIYYDGLVLASGIYPTDQVPQFSGPGAQAGMWGGRPFTNLIRNGDLEQGWVYVRPEVERLVARFARRSPARIVASFYDIGTILRLELRDYLPWMVFNAFGSYGWRIILRDPLWQYLLPGFALLCAVGALRGTRQLRQIAPGPRMALIVLAIASTSIWAFILIAQLPVNFPGSIPVPRYGFTVLAPTMLVATAGWLALWPQRHRSLAAVVLIIALMLLNTSAANTIQQYANTACINDTSRCNFTAVASPLDLLIP